MKALSSVLPIPSVKDDDAKDTKNTFTAKDTATLSKQKPKLTSFKINFTNVNKEHKHSLKFTGKLWNNHDIARFSFSSKFITNRNVCL